MNARLLIPAAGLGVRLGAAMPKALIPLAGEPMLARTLARFQPLGLLRNAVILVAPGYQPVFEAALAPIFPEVSFRFVAGGAERQESVGNGLAAMGEDADIVVIHDAARPFVAAASIQASIDAAAAHGAASVAIPSVDTILVGDEDAFLQDTPDRTRLWACQTPQTFRIEVIREAHRRAREDGFLGTDDASLVRRIGGSVKLVHGTRLNLKVTTPEDWRLAELIAGGQLA